MTMIKQPIVLTRGGSEKPLPAFGEARLWRQDYLGQQDVKGTPEEGKGGLKEIVVSSEKLVMAYTERAWRPPTDVYETTEEIVVKIELGRINHEDVTISLAGNKLTIKGKRYDRDPRTKRTYRQMEINYGNFERTIILHGPINPRGIHALYKDGLIEIVIPKAKKPASTPIHIEIELGK